MSLLNLTMILIEYTGIASYDYTDLFSDRARLLRRKGTVFSVGGVSVGGVSILRANGCPWDAGTIALARKYGHDDVVIWAKANGAPDEPAESDDDSD